MKPKKLLQIACLTPGNVDDRRMVPSIAKDLFGKLFGDRVYFCNKLFEPLRVQGVELITKLRKNMQPRLLSLIDKILLRKRTLIETVNDQLKNICQIEHYGHHSPNNAFVHLLAGLTAYIWQEKQPALIKLTLIKNYCRNSLSKDHIKQNFNLFV